MNGLRRACLIATLLAAGCAPTWTDDSDQIAAPRIIAITVEPPEAAPGAPVTMTAVAATADGPAPLPVEWAFCRSPKPLAENGAVHPDCLDGPLANIGPAAPAVTASTPPDACRLFGP